MSEFTKGYYTGVIVMLIMSIVIDIIFQYMGWF